MVKFGWARFQKIYKLETVSRKVKYSITSCSVEWTDMKSRHKKETGGSKQITKKWCLERWKENGFINMANLNSESPTAQGNLPDNHSESPMDNHSSNDDSSDDSNTDGIQQGPRCNTIGASTVIKIEVPDVEDAPLTYQIHDLDSIKRDDNLYYLDPMRDNFYYLESSKEQGYTDPSTGVELILNSSIENEENYEGNESEWDDSKLDSFEDEYYSGMSAKLLIDSINSIEIKNPNNNENNNINTSNSTVNNNINIRNNIENNKSDIGNNNNNNINSKLPSTLPNTNLPPSLSRCTGAILPPSPLGGLDLSSIEEDQTGPKKGDKDGITILPAVNRNSATIIDKGCECSATGKMENKEAADTGAGDAGEVAPFAPRGTRKRDFSEISADEEGTHLSPTESSEGSSATEDGTPLHKRKKQIPVKECDNCNELSRISTAAKIALASSKRELNAQMQYTEELKKHADNDIKTLESKHNDTIERLGHEIDSLESELRAKYDNEIEILKSRYDDTIKRLEREITGLESDSKVKQESEIEKTKAEMSAHYDKYIDGLEKRHAEDVRVLKSKRADIIQGFEDLKIEVRSKMAAEMDELKRAADLEHNRVLN